MQFAKTDDGAKLPTALDLSRVSHFYGRKQALSEISFSILPGQFAVLLGLNGAGKTTLLSLISHLYNTRHGSIRIFGYDISREPGEALRRLGIVFQPRTLDLDLSVYQNLSYHASLHGLGHRLAMDRIETLMADVNMSDRLNDKARSLSGGQMRRVEIVRALLHRPPLLLLDEATVGLDIQSRAEIIATIRELVVADGITVMWATHLIDEVDENDRVIILHRGKVLEDSSVHAVVRAASAENMREAFVTLTGSIAKDGAE